VAAEGTQRVTLDIAGIAIDPPVLLAPLAGITDLPYRRLVSRFGAGLVVSEMIASGEFLTARPGSREKAELGAGIVNTSVQLAGRAPEPMAEAARIVADMGARVIDINMGCPAKKVVGGYSGSALLRDLDHAVRLIDAVVGAVDVPVTLKTRLGWDDDLHNAPELAKRAQEAGVKMITIHGRTRCQFYKGHADWQAIEPVVEVVTIPVIANGDIKSPSDARAAIRLSGAAGVMVGRGAQGKPWLLAQIAAANHGGPAPTIPEGADLATIVSDHYVDMLGFYGKGLGCRVARKHLGWYMDGAGTPEALRREVLVSEDPERVLSMLPDALATQDRSAA
jgi:tRNA-dihydrouridine synthase B